MTGEEDPLGRQKEAAEPRWRAALVAFWRDQLERVKKKLAPGIPKSRKAVEDLPKRLDKDFWSGEDDELMSVLLPLLSQAAQEAGQASAEAIGSEFGLSIDWTLVNTDAVAWARQYGYDLVRGINNTTKEQLQQVISLWVETPGATMGDLYEELAGLPSFNDYRAKLVAITEVTRSYAEGSLASARAYETEGLFEWAKTWQTNNDDIVCPICSGLHDETVTGTDGVFSNGLVAPPAHPGCRCWTTLRPVIGEE